MKLSLKPCFGKLENLERDRGKIVTRQRENRVVIKTKMLDSVPKNAKIQEMAHTHNTGLETWKVP